MAGPSAKDSPRCWFDKNQLPVLMQAVRCLAINLQCLQMVLQFPPALSIARGRYAVVKCPRKLLSFIEATRRDHSLKCSSVSTLRHWVVHLVSRPGKSSYVENWRRLIISVRVIGPIKNELLAFRQVLTTSGTQKNHRTLFCFEWRRPECLRSGDQVKTSKFSTRLAVAEQLLRAGSEPQLQ